jgi:hypothetical protein
VAARFSVLNWNLNAFTPHQTAEKLDLLSSLPWDVATLHELLPNSIRQVGERFSDCEVVVREPNASWPRPGVRRRCAVLVRRSVEFVEPVERWTATGTRVFGGSPRRLVARPL